MAAIRDENRSKDAETQVWMKAIVMSGLIGLALVLLGWLITPEWPVTDRAQMGEFVVSMITLIPVFYLIAKHRDLAVSERRARHYQAWQAISDAQSKPGSGGRKDALEDLHGDGVSLVGVDLSGGAFLRGLSIPGVRMDQANLEDADLTDADLRQGCLDRSTLRRAILHGANFAGASLECSNFQGAVLNAEGKKTDFAGANLKAAMMEHIQVRGADLSRACLESAQMRDVIWRECSFVAADLSRADLADARAPGCDFGGATLTNARLLRTDLSEARNLNAAQILSAADRRGALLPPELAHLQVPLS